jgi:hypothetical protein
MKKTARRLTLSRETLLRLDERKLRTLAGGTGMSDNRGGCESPLCGPTYWESCEPCNAN